MSTKDEAELDLGLDETDETEGEGGEGSEKEPTPEELKASVANLERALKKANREAAKLRNERKAGEEPKGKPEEKPAETVGEDRYKRSAVSAAARAELKDAGFSGTKEQAAKLSRLLDLDDLDVDEDGEVDGLEDAVAELKEQFPALFAAAPEEKPKVPKVSTAPKNTGPGSISTSTDKVAEDRYKRMFGIPERGRKR